MSNLSAILNNQGSLDEIAQYLDRLSHESRLGEVGGLSKEEQGQLYQIAKVEVTLADLIPPEIPESQEVIFYGFNTLPIFSTFQKRMCRGRNEIIGYNFQSMQWVTGPGYFVVTDKPQGTVIDYTKPPGEALPHWPRITANDHGMARMVYGGLKDYLRRVSREVFIGHPTKKGASLGQYFILCRKAIHEKNPHH